uniref:Protein sidekick-1 n=1 Tax=Schistocephalus solidus TaxID=70667 RepID=A0A0X3Q531_SCHSO
MRPSDVSLIWLLLLSRSSHQVTAADPSLSARVERVTENTVHFKWTQPASDDHQYVRLRATPTTGNGSPVEAQVAVVHGLGSLANLEPYTNYVTSVIYLNAGDNTKSLLIDTGRLRTWPGAPSPPTIKSVVSTGDRSIQVSWYAPEKSNGKIREYMAACYLLGYGIPAASKRVDAQTLSAELTYLSSNSQYECDVTATTEGVGWMQGGGKTSSERSSLVKTWPGTTEQPMIKSAIARGPRSVYLEWWRPNSVYGNLDHYIVTMARNDDPGSAKEIKTKSDSLKLLITQLQPNTEYSLTIRAYVLPNEEGQGGGYSEESVPKLVRTLANGPIASVNIFDSIEKYNWESGAIYNDGGASVLEIAN